MSDFNRKVEGASARVSQTINEAAERLEKEIPEFIKYLNDEVVPRGAHALHQSSARGLAETHRIRRLHGAARPPAEINIRVARFSGARHGSALVVRVAMLLFVLIAILLSQRMRPSQTGTCGGCLRRHRRRPRRASRVRLSQRRSCLLPTFLLPKSLKPLKMTTRTSPNLPFPRDAKPLDTETGRASWYGPPWHNRRGSNGEVYNMHAMTAAHRTYPLGSVVRVTNLKTGHSALVRITDRGPFIPGRVLDSLAGCRSQARCVAASASPKSKSNSCLSGAATDSLGRKMGGANRRIPSRTGGCSKLRRPPLLEALPHSECVALQESCRRLVDPGPRAR